MGLNVDDSAPLVVYIGRLVEQKGADVLLAALPSLLGPPAPTARNPHTGGSVRDCTASQLAGIQGPAGEAQRAAPPDAAPRSTTSPGSVALCLPDDGSAGPPAEAAHLQVLMLGQGVQWQEAVLSQLAAAWPGRAAGHVGFCEPLAHLAMAGADFLVVPSR
jgi:glycosyltransferase involved in cell wall biosynthesis